MNQENRTTITVFTNLNPLYPARTPKTKGPSKKYVRYCILHVLFILPITLFCQAIPNKQGKDTTVLISALDSSREQRRVAKQTDLIDIAMIIVGKNPSVRLDSNKTKTGHVHVSAAPSPAYSLATGLAFTVTGNLAFYLSEHDQANISSILIAPLVTIKKQFTLPIQFSVWTKNNKYNIVGDWRFLTYPESTYGLGGLTKPTDTTSLDYDYVRMYTFVMKTIAKDFYAGIGYQYDNHWNIQQLNVQPNKITSFDNYGFSRSSISSGVSADILFDNRRNSINPEAGSSYANIVFRQNLRALGSDENWESLLIDIRKYVRLNDHTDNVLALWSYNSLTLNGNPPYMDLPSTGWDTYGNTGRGYIQSRFRSKSMVDFEAEYRFGILRDGLLSGVVFGNAQGYSETNGTFESINPGYGAGLRIKFNKFSKANICFDYAFGLHGSNGLFVNLGEVF